MFRPATSETKPTCRAYESRSGVRPCGCAFIIVPFFVGNICLGLKSHATCMPMARVVMPPVGIVG